MCMKKIFAVFILIFFSIECFAEDVFLYKGTVVQNTSNCKKDNKRYKGVVNLPETKTFHLLSDDFVYPESTPLIATAASSASSLAFDPYIVPIDGVRYILIKDRIGGKWCADDIFGINDEKSSRFSSLISLDTNHDLKITADEIKTANLRFAKLSSDYTIQARNNNTDYNLSGFQYIDLNSIKRVTNSDNAGIFGHFNMYYIARNGARKIAIGYVTYDDAENSKYIFE